LNGTLLTTGNAPTTVFVYWGPTNGQTNKASWAHTNVFGVCAAGQSLTTNITGLLSGTLYYYQFNATNAYGDVWAGASTNFTTPGRFYGGSYDGYDRNETQWIAQVCIPTVDNASGATNVQPYSAWLNGTLVSTGAAPSTVFVYWGPIDGLTNKVIWAHTNVFGVCAAGQSLTTNVIGLLSGVRYYYQFNATNIYGEAWAGVSASFLTLQQGVVYTIR
jgi:hypothetical protein